MIMTCFAGHTFDTCNKLKNIKPMAKNPNF